MGACVVGIFACWALVGSSPKFVPQDLSQPKQEVRRLDLFTYAHPAVWDKAMSDLALDDLVSMDNLAQFASDNVSGSVGDHDQYAMPGDTLSEGHISMLAQIIDVLMGAEPLDADALDVGLFDEALASVGSMVSESLDGFETGSHETGQPTFEECASTPSLGVGGSQRRRVTFGEAWLLQPGRDTRDEWAAFRPKRRRQGLTPSNMMPSNLWRSTLQMETSFIMRSFASCSHSRLVTKYWSSHLFVAFLSPSRGANCRPSHCPPTLYVIHGQSQTSWACDFLAEVLSTILNVITSLWLTCAQFAFEKHSYQWVTASFAAALSLWKHALQWRLHLANTGYQSPMAGQNRI